MHFNGLATKECGSVGIGVDYIKQLYGINIFRGFSYF